MIKALVRKDLTLLVPFPLYCLLLLGAMTVIPNYPIIVGVGYVVMLIFFVFQFARENRDAEFSAMLPVSRDDTVNARVMTVILLEVLQLAFAAIGAGVSTTISPNGNLVGLDPNLTFFGTALFALTAFNLTFLPLHYRTGVKVGAPVLLGLVAFLGAYGVVETVVQAVPTLRMTLDGMRPETMGWQAIVFGAGLIAYVAGASVAARLSRKAFEKADL